MNPDFARLLAYPADDRRGLFAATAGRLGTTVQNVEKDFWVCWVLDALFNGLPADGPQLLFKGGSPFPRAMSQFNPIRKHRRNSVSHKR